MLHNTQHHSNATERTKQTEKRTKTQLKIPYTQNYKQFPPQRAKACLSRLQYNDYHVPYEHTKPNVWLISSWLCTHHLASSPGSQVQSFQHNLEKIALESAAAWGRGYTLSWLHQTQCKCMYLQSLLLTDPFTNMEASKVAERTDQRG